jgi:hypothetical protein
METRVNKVRSNAKNQSRSVPDLSLEAEYSS